MYCPGSLVIQPVYAATRCQDKRPVVLRSAYRRALLSERAEVVVVKGSFSARVFIIPEGALGWRPAYV